MIFGEQKPIEALIEKIAGHKKILIAGCATCVAECAAGGEEEVETLAPLLSMALRKKGIEISIETCVIEKQCEYEFLEEIAEKILHVDAVLSLACGIGVQALAERFKNTPVYPAVNTAALTIREQEGVWATRCVACGDCVLGETFGICPVSRCSKSLLNGPCGGTRSSGKCEISEELDCAWGLIIDRAESCGKTETLITVNKPKNWSTSSHGGPKRKERKDLKP
ncbi:MAG: methylenetetrahydrofolate reductase C-terminal domain-containing protein [Deltaproteobacteria bacterium]|nr:methylenetetrahydrofolate reductase C-terminal domain-containing protein [Deltaproteobacteria bacterium]